MYGGYPAFAATFLKLLQYLDLFVISHCSVVEDNIVFFPLLSLKLNIVLQFVWFHVVGLFMQGKKNPFRFAAWLLHWEWASGNLGIKRKAYLRWSNTFNNDNKNICILNISYANFLNKNEQQQQQQQQK